jgi:hypothetical protein
MVEAFADLPARSCYSPASETGSPRFQRVDPDLSSRARARGNPHPTRRRVLQLSIRPESMPGVLNLIGPGKIGREDWSLRRQCDDILSMILIMITLTLKFA